MYWCERGEPTAGSTRWAAKLWAQCSFPPPRLVRVPRGRRRRVRIKARFGLISFQNRGIQVVSKSTKLQNTHVIKKNIAVNFSIFSIVPVQYLTCKVIGNAGNNCIVFVCCLLSLFFFYSLMQFLRPAVEGQKFLQWLICVLVLPRGTFIVWPRVCMMELNCCKIIVSTTDTLHLSGSGCSP